MPVSVQKAFLKNHRIICSHQPDDLSLLGGKLGLALYYFSLCEAFDKEYHGRRCVELVEEILNEIDEKGGLSSVSFGSGTAGLFYLLCLLGRNGLLEIDLAEEMGDTDAAIVGEACQLISRHDYVDYLHGAMGVAHYLASRLPDPLVEAHLAAIIDALYEKAVKEEDGIWFRNLVLEGKDKESINLSLSHGLAGLLLILLEAAEKGFKHPHLDTMIGAGTQFLLAQRTTPGDEQFSLFPASISLANRESPFFTPRLAWCYGDLNAVLLLYRAAAYLKRPEWKDLADEIGLYCTTRLSPESTLATDSHFCHGSSGLAHYYFCLHAIRPLPEYAQAAAYWTSQSLVMLERDLEEGFYKGRESGLLEGLAGVNLHFISTITGKPLSWSAAFLLS